MQHTINRVELQGRTGPPTIRLSPDELIYASSDLLIDDDPQQTVRVCGVGIDAANIADNAAGNTLYVEGELTFDPDRKQLCVFARTARRMAEQGGVLVTLPSSMMIFDRFERVFLEETPAGA